ncbi:MAG: DUF423 domain-containing protein [Bacteroidales bacterium]|jgi:uncharacterized membrane protein YgdD (TMEM256/DUF423 family)
MTKQFLITSSILGGTAVIFSTISNYVLQGNIGEAHLHQFTNGVNVQMFYTVILLAITFMNRFVERSYLNVIYYLFLIGVVAFCIPTYLLSIAELTGNVFDGLSTLAPIGLLLMFVGWMVLFYAGLRYKHKKTSSKH